jgi:hypothetical protein
MAPTYVVNGTTASGPYCRLDICEKKLESRLIEFAETVSHFEHDRQRPPPDGESMYRPLSPGHARIAGGLGPASLFPLIMWESLAGGGLIL